MITSRASFAATALAVVGLLGAAACSSDLQTSSEGTTAAAADGAAPDGAAAIVPEVECIDNARRVYFSYRNESAVAVAVDPAASVVAGGDPADEPLVPHVFAPGVVTAAFWVVPPGNVVDPPAPAWTITAPDGVTRVATADDATEACPDDVGTLATGDDRAADLELVHRVEPGDASAPETAMVTATVVGLGTDSRCPAGLDPLPVSSWIEVEDSESGEIATVGGLEAQTSVRFVEVTSAAGADPVLVAQASVRVIVLDRCSMPGDETVVLSSWPAAPALRRLDTGLRLCLEDTPGGVTAEIREFNGNCGGIPATDGIRMRRIPPV